MISITGYLKTFAENLKSAANLTIEIFKKIIQELDKILKDKNNFELSKETPLKFSPAGLQKLKIEGYDFRKQLDMPDVLKRLDEILSWAVKVEDKEQPKLVQLYESLRAPGSKWLRMNIKNKEFEDARSILRHVLNFVEEQVEEIDATKTKPGVSLQDIQEMKQHGILKAQ